MSCSQTLTLLVTFVFGALPDRLIAKDILEKQLDSFDETLHLFPLPLVPDSPQLFLARFEFNIRAEVSAAFRRDQFDLFPKPIGKLLNAHRSIDAFEATLTRGRWKSSEWGHAPREFRPPGGALVAALSSGGNSTAGEEDTAFRFLVSTLAGSLCASFEGMEPSLSVNNNAAASEGREPGKERSQKRSQTSGVGARPLGLASDWAAPGKQLRLATLPYEPVCTENLTPWLKLLPCGRHRGLAALLAPLSVAESPLVSLALAAAVHPSAVELRASLDVVLPVSGDSGGGLSEVFQDLGYPELRCQAAASSQVLLSSGKEFAKEVLQTLGAKPEVLDDGRVHVLSVPASSFPGFSWKSSLLVVGNGKTAEKAVVASVLPAPGGGELSVMRDMLSKEGRSERTHAQYLLRLNNEGRGRRVRFMEQLPFFIRPLWHSFRAVFREPGASSEADKVLEVAGLEAMQRLGLQLTASDGLRSPTEFFLSLDIPPGGSVSIFLDVMKSFIQLREFSYACEKGFDVGGAAWLEADLPLSSGVQSFSAVSTGPPVGTSDFIASLGKIGPLGRPHLPEGTWRLRFTEGLIVLLPMPDFSMPFNVIALSSTAVTFFFGSIFRITAAGHLPHWSSTSFEKTKKPFKLIFVSLIFAFLYLETQPEFTLVPAELVQKLRELVPEDWIPVVNEFEIWKAEVEASLKSSLSKR
eukprot:TRINITY_DN31893_c0_g1_i1.p1 TRINITY_DN31893_c0_g1~~TRINITY_DN31893_c0_g1_i1.p1  ORF type:complete len:695 (-),score=130.73 TRINITY_DN31893_c0_g1_i1:69-2153(-)